MNAIIKKDISKRLNDYQLGLYREFRKECNTKLLEYQIERYSDPKHKLYNYFKNKTNDWTSPFWAIKGEEIILFESSDSGIGISHILFCPIFGITKSITDLNKW